MRRRSFLGSLVGAAMCIVAPILAPGRPWEWDEEEQVTIMVKFCDVDWWALSGL